MADRPKRIQLRRTKGWRKPEGAIVVARPTKWGNPFRIVDGFGEIGNIFEVGHEWSCPSLSESDRDRAAAAEATRLFRLWWTEGLVLIHGKGDGYESRHIEHGTTLPDDLAGDEIATWHRAPDDLRARLIELAGHDLACWCPLAQPCHADVLLELANSEVTRG